MEQKEKGIGRKQHSEEWAQCTECTCKKLINNEVNKNNSYYFTLSLMGNPEDKL